MDHAAAYACRDGRVVFVIWTDFDTSSGGTNGPTIDGVYSAFLLAESGTQVDCECKTGDGTSGTLTIHVDEKLVTKVPFTLEQGNVFLISTRDDAPEITQMKRDIFYESVDAKEDVTARLQELAVADDEVNAFLTR